MQLTTARTNLKNEKTRAPTRIHTNTRTYVIHDVVSVLSARPSAGWKAARCEFSVCNSMYHLFHVQRNKRTHVRSGQCKQMHHSRGQNLRVKLVHHDTQIRQRLVAHVSDHMLHTNCSDQIHVYSVKRRKCQCTS